MSATLKQIAELVTRESGIKMDLTSDAVLVAAIQRTIPGIDPAELLLALSDGAAAANVLSRLIDELTINETFFFRHPDELVAVDWLALQSAASAAGSARVRVWVAGCASGEEAYTLAILASEAFAPESCPVSILGTDICSTAVLAAERGVYGTRAIRPLEPHLRDRYFTEEGGRLAVSQSVRKIARFERHNLVRDQVPPPATGSFELITCRNVLIYFGPETADRVIASLRRALTPGGSLILGAADRISAGTRSMPAAPSSRVRRGGAVRRRAARGDTATRIARTRAARSATVVAPAHSGWPQDPSQVPDGTFSPGLRAALAEADAGRLEAAVKLASAALDADPLDAEAHFVRGLAELGAGDTQAAVVSLRKALYARPEFTLAAFKLGCALEVGGEADAAAKAYGQALRTLDRHDAGQVPMLEQVSAGDIAAACRLRLRALATGLGGGERTVVRGARS